MNEEEFFAKLLETFRIEADEHLKTLSNQLVALEGNMPEDQRAQAIETIFREAHSLKGAARAVNQNGIEKICQALENVLSAWKKNQLQPTSELFDTLYAILDVLEKALTTAPDQSTIVNSIQQLNAFLEKQNPKGEEVLAPQPIEKAQEPKIEEVAEVKQSEAPKEKSIRVTLTKMNRIFQEAEEMIMVKLISQQQVKDLKQLLVNSQGQEKELAKQLSESQISLHEGEANSKILAFIEYQRQEKKAFRDTLNRMVRMAEQNAHFVGSMVDTLLEDMKKILMQPMKILFEGLPRMIRDIAKELGKEIRVEFEGEDIEVDRRILEEIKDPVIHLIRNAIDHGIETPEERKKKNKPSYGTIKIQAAESDGNNVTLSITDDGKGINLEKIKQKIVQQGLLSQKEVDQLTQEEVTKYIFHSGISTSPMITELSGRGLGLGIVSEKADKLGGQVFLDFKKDEGTTFRLILPLTLATFRGIHVTIAGQDFIMPTHNVKRVLRLKKDDIKTIENYETISVDQHSLSFINLADLLGLVKPVQKESKEDTSFALVLSAAETTMAFGVDGVHREHEVLIKGLGKQCVRVKNVMAATVMEWGNVIPILNPADLIRSSVKQGALKAHPKEMEEEEIQKVILLVEDSMTTRLLLKNILESAGYVVKAAVDGLEALEVLQAQDVDLILTDIEMPRMDGFVLIKKIKSMPTLKDVPIIICTSRGSREDREKGIELGANAYLDKSSFTQQGLLSILQKLL